MYTSNDPDLPASCGQRMLKEGQSIKSSRVATPNVWRKMIRKMGNLEIGKRIIISHMGVSKNSVPLNPMVTDHYPY